MKTKFTWNLIATMAIVVSTNFASAKSETTTRKIASAPMELKEVAEEINTEIDELVPAGLKNRSLVLKTLTNSLGKFSVDVDRCVCCWSASTNFSNKKPPESKPFGRFFFVISMSKYKRV